METILCFFHGVSEPVRTEWWQAGFVVRTGALVMIRGCDWLQAHEYLIWKESSTAAKVRGIYPS